MITISNYHYIREDFSAPYPSVFGVTPMRFKHQLKLLKNEGDLITPSEFLANYEELVVSKDNFFFITFDDGLKEQFSFALPILDEFGMQAIFFANSMNVEEKRVSTVHKIHLLRSVIPSHVLLNYLKDQKIAMLTHEELQQAKTNYRFDDAASAELKYLLNFKISFDVQELLVQSIFEKHFSESEILESLYMSKAQLQYLANIDCLGSHTHTHYPLGLLSEDNLTYELKHSKNYLEKLSGKAIQMIAYPYGTPEACTDLVAETAKKVGYLYGFTTRKGIIEESQNKLLLNRFDCNDVVGGKNYKL
ncbi:polysaccharide deacetylase family protein [Flavobacterium sp. LMO8]|uniref:polysaccharide deacetylase family protein n=1 Tax=Flavobacterium sp. LMO8 TaxID=2654244 RepID=UPI001291155E|nr:polysaccharide deacetylase family protein [Flavobacterium sp. LMO8]MQP24768.1 polysaccharide deacetylase family protein [Flavobacterium sp. LMO8]